MSKRFLFLVVIAMATLGLLVSEPITNPLDHATLAWNCGDYTFSVNNSGHVSLDTGANGWDEPAQKADVFINSTKVATFSVPTTTANKHYDLGDVPVPSNGFDWEVKGQDDCGNKGHTDGQQQSNDATPQISYDCEKLTYTITAVAITGTIDHLSSDFDLSGPLPESAKDIPFTVIFTSGPPVQLVGHVEPLSGSGCALPGVNHAEAHVTPNCQSGLATINLTASPGVTSVTPDVPMTVTLKNVKQTFDFIVTFESGTPNPITVTAVVKDKKSACKTKEVPPGNPDHDWCPVGNAIGAVGGYVVTSGIAYNAKDYGKGWIALEVQLPYSVHVGSTYTLVYGRNTQTIKVKQLGGDPKDRCEVVSTDIIDPVVSTAKALSFDMGAGGPGTGPVVGTLTIGNQGWNVMKFAASGSVNPELGNAAFVKFQKGFVVGVHITDLQRQLEVGAEIQLFGVTYKVAKVQVMEKSEAGKLRKGGYLITCTSDFSQNTVYTLQKV